VCYSAILAIVIVLSFHYHKPSSTEANVKLSWPKTGEAAIGVVGKGVLETHGEQTDRPTASTAKLITALTVLKKYPLQPGQNGPVLTMSRSDINLLITYDELDGSEIGKVVVGEKLSEYQMLEAMMLPSANNMADSLAVWAFGSLADYQIAAAQTVKSLGMASTTVGSDASGLSPDTLSTAHDLVLLGEAAMQNPVLAEIVSKSSVDDFPLIGTIENTNTLLGQDGIVGVKTGNSDEAGGVFVFAAKYNDDSGKEQIIVGAVQGLPDLEKALQAAKTLLKSAEKNINRL